ncbi:MAG: AbrB/MazE/SpoVT family DNA-binding domain-containing protein [Halobacteriaceae archaeon]
MDDESDDGVAWPPAMFARGFQEASEQAIEGQREFYEQLFSGSGGGLPGMSLGTATFKARVQSGGRISIPDAERDALGIEEGDLVQTVVVPIRKGDRE